MIVLVINAGSSSMKFLLIDMPSEAVLTKGTVEKISDGVYRLYRTAYGKTMRKDFPAENHQEAIKYLLTSLLAGENPCIASVQEIGAIGHRIAHGGASYQQPVRITEEVIAEIHHCEKYAPLHNGANLAGIYACLSVFGPEIPQVAVFDTAFHRTLPPYAYLYPLPYQYYEKYGIRRYGFHGLSHRYVSQRCGEIMGRRDSKVITCHLGNGCSLAAVRNGVCMDTTMGFTPNEGIMMGTRCGSIDPAVPAYIAEQEGVSYEEALRICTHQSGLLGISGISGDYRALMRSKDPRAKLALEMQWYQILKFIGAYWAVMGGVDAIVFTGGIGENIPQLRQYICNHLQNAGVALDSEANLTIREEGRISTAASAIAVYVIPSNEELVIARDVYTLMKGKWFKKGKRVMEEKELTSLLAN